MIRIGVGKSSTSLGLLAGVKVKVKVKNKLIKRHKTTHSVQIQRRWLRYS